MSSTEGIWVCIIYVIAFYLQLESIKLDIKSFIADSQDEYMYLTNILKTTF